MTQGTCANLYWCCRVSSRGEDDGSPSVQSLRVRCPSWPMVASKFHGEN